MSETQTATRMLHARMPLEVAKDIKIEAARKETSVQDWLCEAAVEKLRREARKAATA